MTQSPTTEAREYPKPATLSAANRALRAALMERDSLLHRLETAEKERDELIGWERFAKIQSDLYMTCCADNDSLTSELSPLKAERDALREALEDVPTHCENWIHAMQIAKDLSPEPVEDRDDKSYWQHEMDVVRRINTAARQALSGGE